MKKKGNSASIVLDVLQDMGNELKTSAQGKIGRLKEETTMYSTNTDKKDTTGQPTERLKIKLSVNGVVKQDIKINLY